MLYVHNNLEKITISEYCFKIAKKKFYGERRGSSLNIWVDNINFGALIIFIILFYVIVLSFLFLLRSKDSK
jgi:hypothetical protein